MKSFGNLKYDPKHDGTTFKDWWIILSCHDSIALYYRWWIEKQGIFETSSDLWLDKNKIQDPKNQIWPINQYGIKTTRSAWGAHISVVRGEVPKNKNLWRKHQDKKINFRYDPETLNTNGKHWWIEIESLELEEIRQELGLTPKYNYLERRTGIKKELPFHLTLGHSIKL